jgi:hypothetical protein
MQEIAPLRHDAVTVFRAHLRETSRTLSFKPTRRAGTCMNTASRGATHHERMATLQIPSR